MSNEQVKSGLKYKFNPEDSDTYSNVNCTTPYGTLYRKYVISQKCVKVAHAFIVGKWFRLFFPNAGNLVIPLSIYREISDNNRILVMADSVREWFATGINYVETPSLGDSHE